MKLKTLNKTSDANTAKKILPSPFLATKLGEQGHALLYPHWSLSNPVMAEKVRQRGGKHKVNY
jgi:hypothetical protein